MASSSTRSLEAADPLERAHRVIVGRRFSVKEDLEDFYRRISEIQNFQAFKFLSSRFVLISSVTHVSSQCLTSESHATFLLSNPKGFELGERSKTCWT